MGNKNFSQCSMWALGFWSFTEWQWFVSNRNLSDTLQKNLCLLWLFQGDYLCDFMGLSSLTFSADKFPVYGRNFAFSPFVRDLPFSVSFLQLCFTRSVLPIWYLLGSGDYLIKWFLLLYQTCPFEVLNFYNRHVAYLLNLNKSK